MSVHAFGPAPAGGARCHTAGEDLWQYEYLVSGVAFTADQGFTIFFTPSLYTLLQNPPPFVNADWDLLTVQPDLALNSSGFYDALALHESPSLADPFKLRFVWLGAGVPGAQPYTIYDTDFPTISHGQTTPEPSAAALLFTSLAALAMRKRK